MPEICVAPASRGAARAEAHRRSSKRDVGRRTRPTVPDGEPRAMVDLRIANTSSS